MIINEAGTYTLKYTATDDCGKTSTVDRELVVTVPIYGAEWDGSESPVWTRTDSSALFADPVPQYSDGNGGWVGGSSPFDDLMPWSGMQIVEDAEAGTLVSIPKFYYKWTRDGAKMKLQISPNEQEGFFVSPAHMDRGDGVGERDVVYVGRYHCADTFKSVTGVVPQRSMKIGVFRTSIHSLGTDIWQYDFATYWTIAMLYLVEFADWNSQAKIGMGCAMGNNGATDAMTYHTGTDASSRDNNGQVQYRHIEGLWSNGADFCDGIYLGGGYYDEVYCIKNPANFSNTTGGENVGTAPTSSFIPKTFTEPPVGYEYALFMETGMTGSVYSEYVCDLWYYSWHGETIAIGAEGAGGAYGLFGIIRRQDPSSANIGARLMKLPSA